MNGVWAWWATVHGVTKNQTQLSNWAHRLLWAIMLGWPKKFIWVFLKDVMKKPRWKKANTKNLQIFIHSDSRKLCVLKDMCCGLACKLKDILGDGLRPNIRKSRIKTHRLVQRKCHNRYDALTGASQRKTCHVIILICGTQRNSTEGPIQDRRWATDTENKLWLPEGEQGYREVNWELGIDTDTLLYIK